MVDVATDREIVTRVKVADGFFSRLIGLLSRSSLGSDEGLWIAGCDSVHTIGMRFDIDLVFLDRAGVVLKIVSGAARNRPYFGKRGAASVLELAAGAASQMSVGDRVALFDVVEVADPTDSASEA